jgi:hypothetical protein
VPAPYGAIRPPDRGLTKEATSELVGAQKWGRVCLGFTARAARFMIRASYLTFVECVL